MSTLSTKATIAAVALSAVAVTGSTLALWEDGSTTDSTTVTTGHLTIEDGDTSSAADVSAGTTARTIDLTQFKAVPGDVLRVAQTYTVDADGDNIAAQLTFDNGMHVGDPTNVLGVTLQDAYVVAGAANALTATGAHVGDLSTPVDVAEGTTAYTVVYELAFDADYQADMDAAAIVTAFNVTLNQVRA